MIGANKESKSYWIILFIWIFLFGLQGFSLYQTWEFLFPMDDFFLSNVPMIQTLIKISFLLIGFIGLVQSYKTKDIFNSFLTAFSLFYVLNLILMMPIDVSGVFKTNQLLEKDLGLRKYLFIGIPFILIIPILIVYYLNRRNLTSKDRPSKKSRFIHLTVDTIFILYYTIFIMGVIFPLFPKQPFGFFTSLSLIIFTSYCLVSIFYYLISEYVFNATFGKIITKTAVVGKEGIPSFSEILFRSLTRLIPFDSFSILGQGRTNAWHDSLSNTSVVLTEKNSSELI